MNRFPDFVRYVVRRLKVLCSSMGKKRLEQKYILSDKGRQFWCRRFKAWFKRRGIRPRYASAGGQVRATAIVERFMRSLKDEWLGHTSVPFRRKAMRQHLSTYLEWFHGYRPHQGLGGKTPTEVHGKK